MNSLPRQTRTAQLTVGRAGGHLATWLDLATREIVGYSMADHHRASLVVDALTMAAAGCSDLPPGCIVHSDRGAEYTADELRQEVNRLGLRQSMGRTGSCYDCEDGITAAVVA